MEETVIKEKQEERRSRDEYREKNNIHCCVVYLVYIKPSLR
jgi:hypothetical protein